VHTKDKVIYNKRLFKNGEKIGIPVSDIDRETNKGLDLNDVRFYDLVLLSKYKLEVENSK